MARWWTRTRSSRAPRSSRSSLAGPRSSAGSRPAEGEGDSSRFARSCRNELAWWCSSRWARRRSGGFAPPSTKRRPGSARRCWSRAWSDARRGRWRLPSRACCPAAPEWCWSRARRQWIRSIPPSRRCGCSTAASSALAFRRTREACSGWDASARCPSSACLPADCFRGPPCLTWCCRGFCPACRWIRRGWHLLDRVACSRATWRPVSRRIVPVRNAGRWNEMTNPYGKVLVDHFRHPRNRGTMANPTISEEGVNRLCGDRVRIELRLDRGRVVDARFSANACALCVAAASVLTELVKGAPLDEVDTLTIDDLLRALGTEVPEGRRNCVRLPLTVLHAGVMLHRRANQLPSVDRSRPVAAIVLAAGRARRFGAQKLLAPYGTSTVVGTVVNTMRAASVDYLVVVVAPGAEAVRAAVGG